MARAKLVVAIAGLLECCAHSAAAQPVSYSVPAGPLGEVIARFGDQSGLSIVIVGSELAKAPSRGVVGRFNKRQALRRLLEGTSATFQFINPRTVRVFQMPRPSQSPRPVPSISNSDRRPLPVRKEPLPPVEIIVTASKLDISLDRYAGSAELIDFDGLSSASGTVRGSDAVIAAVPVMMSTNLGAGRNKLFIRGVADSSFSGPSQATVGQYLGDARLTYNAPDPNLNLYDLARAEVLPGPQGTLYGTGTLGGVVRLIPNLPDASGVAATASAGLSATENGAMGSDAAAMLNVPLVNDRLAVRFVGYRVVDGGYIQNRQLNTDNINRTATYGGRISARYLPGNAWTVDLVAVMQNLESRDGQYTVRGQQNLSRNSALPQPFDNDYQFASVSIGKRWGDAALVSNTTVVHQNLDTTYDATKAAMPAATRLFEETVDISLLSHETRLSGQTADRRNWVLGLTVLSNSEKRRRRLGKPSQLVSIAGVRNELTEAAIFSQYSLPLTSRLSATLGMRLTYTQAAGTLLDSVDGDEMESDRNLVRVIPSLALSWRSSERFVAFLHYQQGNRAGGLAVSPDGSDLAVQRFESDTIDTVEAGWRFGAHEQRKVSASFAAFYTRWTDIQADLVDNTGLPFTTNIGDGTIFGVDAKISWSPTSKLNLEIGGFLNKSKFSDPEPAFLSIDKKDLPNIAKFVGRATASYITTAPWVEKLIINANMRYVGSSQLGFGVPLDVGQGNYLETALGGRLDFGPVAVLLDISNLANARGNRFAYGNPFGLADRNQETPLRPRSIRIGIDARF